MHEGIPILNCLVPKAFLHDERQAHRHELREGARGARRRRAGASSSPTGEPEQVFECDDVLVAVGQENAFPWIERDSGIEFDEWGMPVLDEVDAAVDACRSVFFGGDAAFGPKNIIWAVAHGHEAAVSIDKFLHGEDVSQRPPPGVTLVSQKMGIHEWSYDNEVAPDAALQGALARRQPDAEEHQGRGRARLRRRHRVEGGAALPQLRRADRVHRPASASSATPASTSARRTASPSPPTATRPTCARACARRRCTSTRTCTSPATLKTGRVMVKDEDVCLHCGLCAERCPTGAWDMQKFLLEQTHAGPRLPQRARAATERRPRDMTDETLQARRRGSRPSTISSSSSPTSTARARPRPTSCSRAAILRMGVPVSPRNIFPSNIQGLPTWYEVRVTERGWLGAARRRRPDGGDEPADLGPGPRRDRARRLPVLRQHQAAAGVEVPRRHQRDRHAADRDLQRRATPTRASASCSRTSSTSARSRRCSASSPRSSPTLIGEQYKGKDQAAAAQPRRLQDGPAPRPRALRRRRSA